MFNFNLDITRSINSSSNVFLLTLSSKDKGIEQYLDIDISKPLDFKQLDNFKGQSNISFQVIEEKSFSLEFIICISKCLVYLKGNKNNFLDNLYEVLHGKGGGDLKSLESYFILYREQINLIRNKIFKANKLSKDDKIKYQHNLMKNLISIFLASPNKINNLNKKLTLGLKILKLKSLSNKKE